MDLIIRVEVRIDANIDGLTDEWTEKTDPYMLKAGATKTDV